MTLFNAAGAEAEREVPDLQQAVHGAVLRAHRAGRRRGVRHGLPAEPADARFSIRLKSSTVESSARLGDPPRDTDRTWKMTQKFVSFGPLI